MNNISELNKDLKVYLDSSSNQMIADLKNILLDNSIQYKNGKSIKDVAFLNFDYEYDTLDIIFEVFDKKYNKINNLVSLPTIKKSKIGEKSEWSSFLPEIIWNKYCEFENNYEADNLDDILEEYDNEKYFLFEKWFYSCWANATNETNVIIKAYFSMHDTEYVTDLNTLNRIKTKEIFNLYK